MVLRLNVQRLLAAIEKKDSVTVFTSLEQLVDVAKRIMTHMQYAKEIRDFLEIEARTRKDL